MSMCMRSRNNQIRRMTAEELIELLNEYGCPEDIDIECPGFDDCRDCLRQVIAHDDHP